MAWGASAPIPRKLSASRKASAAHADVGGIIRYCRGKRQLNQETRAFFLVGVGPQLTAVIQNGLMRKSQSQSDAILFASGYEGLK